MEDEPVGQLSQGGTVIETASLFVVARATLAGPRTPESSGQSTSRSLWTNRAAIAYFLSEASNRTGDGIVLPGLCGGISFGVVAELTEARTEMHIVPVALGVDPAAHCLAADAQGRRRCPRTCCTVGRVRGTTASDLNSAEYAIITIYDITSSGPFTIQCSRCPHSGQHLPCRRCCRRRRPCPRPVLTSCDPGSLVGGLCQVLAASATSAIAARRTSWFDSTTFFAQTSRWLNAACCSAQKPRWQCQSGLYPRSIRAGRPGFAPACHPAAGGSISFHWRDSPVHQVRVLFRSRSLPTEQVKPGKIVPIIDPHRPDVGSVRARGRSSFVTRQPYSSRRGP